MSSDAVIHVENLVVEYGRRKARVRAVDGISFDVRPGECVGFIGPNGAGKSSTIKTLMGFVYPNAGRVSVFGETAGTVAAKRRIGYLPEVTLYYPFLTGIEMLRLYGTLHGVPRADIRDRVELLLAQVGLGAAGDRLIRNYSKGMQQRLGIAQALIADPECLIFDELSSGLDPVGRHDLRRVLLELKAGGATVFFSSHELYEVEALCDRVVAIHKGRLLFDQTLQDLLDAAGDRGLEEHFMALLRAASETDETVGVAASESQ